MKLRFAIWALFGAFMVPLDELHNLSGTITGRAHGMEMSLPMFVLAGVMIGAIHRKVVRPPAHSALHALACFVVFAGVYASSSFIGAHTTTAAIVYAALFGVVLVFSKARLQLALWGTTLAIVGPLAEGTLAAMGAFRYAHADLYHVPLWLPPVYLHVAAASCAVAGFMEIALRERSAAPSLAALAYASWRKISARRARLHAQ
jgi:hypothetical protein